MVFRDINVMIVVKNFNQKEDQQICKRLSLKSDLMKEMGA